MITSQELRKLQASKAVITYQLQHEKLSYIGSCVNSFYEDGDSIDNSFPYATVSEFACGEEDAEEITAEQFRDNVLFPKWVDTSHEIYYLWDEWNGVFMLYDSDEDIHYFFGP